MPNLRTQGGGRRALPAIATLTAALLAALVVALVMSPGVPAAPSCLGKRATIASGKSKIVGTKAPDVIVVLGGGKHSVDGEGGNDRICGGSGNDEIDGGKRRPTTSMAKVAMTSSSADAVATP